MKYLTKTALKYSLILALNSEFSNKFSHIMRMPSMPKSHIMRMPNFITDDFKMLCKQQIFVKCYINPMTPSSQYITL